MRHPGWTFARGMLAPCVIAGAHVSAGDQIVQGIIIP